MARQNTPNGNSSTLGAQLLLMRVGMLSIPVYLLLFSPTCGIFGLYVPRNSSLFALVLAELIPAMALSLVGVLKESNLALGIFGIIMTILIIANRMVEPYYAVFDFVFLILFLEVTTTLPSFSRVARSIVPGEDENVSYNFRVALAEYMKREIAVVAITLAFCLGTVFLTASLGTSIGVPAIAFLGTITLLTVFATIALRYHKK
jgi:hypothetical protein